MPVNTSIATLPIMDRRPPLDLYNLLNYSRRTFLEHPVVTCSDEQDACTEENVVALTVDVAHPHTQPPQHQLGGLET